MLGKPSLLARAQHRTSHWTCEKRVDEQECERCGRVACAQHASNTHQEHQPQHVLSRITHQTTQQRRRISHARAHRSLHAHVHATPEHNEVQMQHKQVLRNSAEQANNKPNSLHTTQRKYSLVFSSRRGCCDSPTPKHTPTPPNCPPSTHYQCGWPHKHTFNPYDPDSRGMHLGANSPDGLHGDSGASFVHPVAVWTRTHTTLWRSSSIARPPAFSSNTKLTKTTAAALTNTPTQL